MLEKAETAIRARDASKKSRDLTRSKTVLESSILPANLAYCSNENPSQTELFIVEGDSAGGSAKQGRDRDNQAILPLKGKILNVEKARLDRILSNDEIKALIAAIGAGIGEDFNADKARYHKIILMTDADVDGAHIRTLLLTFFFRYMRTLIEKGYLYIAQPPLYKAKIGRKEQYLKDDRALKTFLFDWAKEQTELTVGKKSIDHNKLTQLLEDLYQYDEQLTHVSTRFNIAPYHAHKLTFMIHQKPWEDNNSNTLSTMLKKHFPQYVITFEQPEIEGDEHESHSAQHGVISFTMLNSRWEVPIIFFGSKEVKKLLTLLQPLIQLETNKWKLQIVGKEKHIINTGVTKLISSISIISKPFMNIQRYKGLGEMNPEQLWETAMDAKTRTLLKVTIEDALEADRWFTTLMGDDVAGRKSYIERYGHFVKNLDV